MNKIDITYLKLHTEGLPNSFRGCRILHISDLHGNVHDKNMDYLIHEAQSLHPDYIFITGDLIDEHHKNIVQVCDFIRLLKKLAPIYYVTGNHEWVTQQRERLFKYLTKIGVHILQDDILIISRDSDKIQLMGMNDPYVLPGKKTIQYQRTSTRAFLERFVKLNHMREKDIFTILLSHRPELIHFYAKSRIPLIFSGHAHGGQFRIIGKNGLLAPHQGFFPKYTAGVIKIENTQMIVSRGLGNSGFPFRIKNPYELILVELS